MFQFIKKIFKSKPNEIENNSIQPLESYFKKELELSEFIKEDSHDIVLDHLFHKIDLNKSGSKLSVSDKKILGINTRLQVTDSLVNVLTPLGLQQNNPKEILTSIYYTATFSKGRDESIQKFKELKLNRYKVDGVGGLQECSWCKSVDEKEFLINEDINLLIKENCTCDSHCRLIISAVTEDLIN